MISFTHEMRQALVTALTDAAPVIVAYADDDGQPHISFRGSAQVYSGDQLAIWVRNPEGGIIAAVGHNPKVALQYQNLAKRIGWQFHGRARVDDDPAVRITVYENSHEFERGLDPEQKGKAIIIDVDRVFARGELLMDRASP